MSSTTSPISGSLLDGLDAEPASPAAAPANAQPRRKLKNPLAPLWRRKKLRYSFLGAFLFGLSLGSYFYFRPVPQPDYALDPMDDVLNYTLLTDEFNKLPIDKRLELLKDLIDRLKTMSADDSSIMAAFAASINTDKLRKQLEENASRLALDVWDKFALDYQKVSSGDRGNYLDKTFLDMTKLMETVAGEHSDKTDEQRLDEAHKQAKHDQEMLSKGEGPTAGQLARMADIMRNHVGTNSSPQQQQRGMQLMRDMTRNLRGQDPSTGK
jgi:hypothetical protein